jgi:hypothetical protein
MSIENNFGFKKYNAEDAKLQEEKLITDLLVDLNEYMPPRIPILNSDDLSMGRGNATEIWIGSFMGHPDRISWLCEFAKTAKDKMRATLPEGVGISVLTEKYKSSGSTDPQTRTKWTQFRNSKDGHTEEVQKAIFTTGRAIREELVAKIQEFEKEDGK